MINPFKRTEPQWTPNLSEIHEYVNDLHRITLLRDKTAEGEERDGYDTIIHVMQQVLVVINKPPVRLK